MMENVLPEGWEKIYLGQIVKLKNGFAFNSSDYLESGIPVVRISDIKNGNVSLDNPVYVAEDIGFRDFTIQNGDILIAMSGATTGKFGVFSQDALAYQNQRVGNIKPHSETLISKRFVYYLIGSLQKKIEEGAYGGAQPNISSKAIEEIVTHLPPLAEQKQIVAKLDVAFGYLETLKASLARIPQLLKTFRQSVLTQAVTGKLTGNLETTLLGDMGVKIQTGPFGSSLHKEDYIENGTPVINPSHIKNGEILPDLSVTISNSKLREVKGFILEDGDVIIGRRGEMGRAAVYNDKFGKMLCGTGSIILKKSPKLSSEFLAYYLRSPFCVDFLTTNAVGSTMVNLNQKIIKSLPFPKLGKEAQENIVKKIEELLSKADAIESQYLSLKEKVDKLPQALIAKAFRGELVPQDPANEPAAVLLEKIHKEIGKLEKKGKKQMKLVFDE